MNRKKYDRIVKDLKQVLSIPPVFLSISKGILNDVSYKEALTVTTVDDYFGGLDLALCVVLIVGGVNVVLQFIDQPIFIELVSDQ